MAAVEAVLGTIFVRLKDVERQSCQLLLRSLPTPCHHSQNLGTERRQKLRPPFLWMRVPPPCSSFPPLPPAQPSGNISKEVSNVLLEAMAARQLNRKDCLTARPQGRFHRLRHRHARESHRLFLRQLRCFHHSQLLLGVNWLRLGQRSRHGSRHGSRHRCWGSVLQGVWLSNSTLKSEESCKYKETCARRNVNDGESKQSVSSAQTLLFASACSA